jgi:phospholipid/cholesterol/gamma-HCH transport system substrate-binding protein
MNKNFVETLLGAVVLVVAVFFLIYSARIGDVSTNTSGYRVYAEFTEIGGLQQGDDVRIAGVKIGTVNKMELQKETYLARVELSINDNIELPDDTASIISSKGLLGGTFLALEPGGSEDMLEDGDRISYNQDAQNLEKLLGQFIFSLNKEGDNAQ